MNMFVGLCLFVSMYDRYNVFMGLIFWVWEIGTNDLFFLIKLPMCFCEEEKKEKKNEEEKKMAIGVSLWIRKKERQRKKKKTWNPKKSLSESVKNKGEKIK